MAVVFALVAMMTPGFLFIEGQAVAQEAAPPAAAAPPLDTTAPEVSLGCPKTLSGGVRGTIFDAEPSSGISGFGYEIYRSDLGIQLLTGSCTDDGAGGISCPPFSPAHTGTYSYIVWAFDGAGNSGSASCDYSILAAQQKDLPGRPDLTLYEHPFISIHWASYADYIMRELTVPLMIYNNGANIAHGVQVTGNQSFHGVTISTQLPLLAGPINPGEAATIMLRHHVPPGVSAYGTLIEASAQDVAGTTYMYP